MNYQKIKKLLPITIIFLLMGIFFLFDLHHQLSYEQIKTYHQNLNKLIHEHPLIMALIAIIFYAAFTALSLPIGVIATITMGYIFPFPLSCLYVVIGATIGASILFLSAKTALREFFYKKAAHHLSKLEPEIRDYGAFYLLILRFIPIFPFWLVNLVPAFVDVRLFTFIWTTFVGIIPGSLVYTYASHSLDSIFAKNQKFAFHNLFTFEVKLAFSILVLFTLATLIIKKIWKKYDR